jgi:hypothetical protein
MAYYPFIYTFIITAAKAPYKGLFCLIPNITTTSNTIHQAKGKVIHPNQQHPQPLNTPNIPLFSLIN